MKQNIISMHTEHIDIYTSISAQGSALCNVLYVCVCVCVCVCVSTLVWSHGVVVRGEEV